VPVDDGFPSPAGAGKIPHSLEIHAAAASLMPIAAIDAVGNPAAARRTGDAAAPSCWNGACFRDPTEGSMIVLKKLLVATDFKPASEAALTYGRMLARTFGASLHVLHVVENFFLRSTPSDPHALVAARTRTLNDLLSGVRRDTTVHVAVTVSDDVGDAIVSYARANTIDAILVGTQGRTGWRAYSRAASPSASSAPRRARCSPFTIQNTNSLAPQTRRARRP